VALAARLALHPKVLILDEPTANVDESSALLVKEAAVSAWKEWGTTVIVATHDLAWLTEVSTDIISLFRGKIVDTDRKPDTRTMDQGERKRSQNTDRRTEDPCPHNGRGGTSRCSGKPFGYRADNTDRESTLYVRTGSGVRSQAWHLRERPDQPSFSSTGDIILKSRMPVEK
jgi:ABC-type cobalt transport system, ATPase component